MLRLHSIRTRLVVVISFLIAVISVFTMFYYPTRLERRMMEAHAEKARSIAKMTAFSISPALYFEDATAAEEASGGVLRNSDFVYLVVLDKNAEVFIEIPKGSANKYAYRNATTEGAVLPGGDVFSVVTPIYHNEELIGSLYLGLSLEDVHAQVVQSRRTSLVVTAVLFIIGVGIAVGISVIMLRPLNQMVQTVEQISAGDLTKRAPVITRDEIGDLARAFNHMVERLAEARRELQEINETLEKRVAERTEALQAEIDRHKETEIALRAAKEEAERASQAKSEFLSRMSHELRTPMNAVLGFAQLLELSPSMSEAQRGHVRQILKAGNHLLQLINEVLDLARIESGRLSVSLEDVALGPVIREAFDTVAPMAADRGIEIIDETEGAESIYVRADRTRLQQVLLNLLSNAIKYNRDQGTVTVATETTPDNLVRISVIDTGPGISEELRDQLFEPFNRLGAENTEIEGTGIGLAIAKRLMELMHGRIDVESTLGVGSRFYIELPMTEPPETHVAEEEALLAEETSSVDSARATILYVEDNPANLALVKDIVSLRPSIELLSAPHAQIGIDLAKSHRPNLIILDINLPDMDGFEALKRLQADPATRDIPTVALSANAMPRDIRRGLAAGFKKYLTKPIDVRELLETIDEFVATDA